MSVKTFKDNGKALVTMIQADIKQMKKACADDEDVQYDAKAHIEMVAQTKKFLAELRKCKLC